MASEDHGDREDPLRFTEKWQEELTLDDGTKIRLRRLRQGDRPALVAAFDRLSPESRYWRFFTSMPRIPAHVLDGLMQADDDHFAIVATGVTEGTAEVEGYGIARFARLSDAPDTAEAAVTVVDQMQRRGLGSRLLSCLVEAALERGITKFRAEVLRSNAKMNALLHEFDENARPIHVDGPMAVYLVELGREPAGPLFRLLNLAAKGVQVVVRHLPGMHHTPGKYPR
ncbi:MAG: GNAT family N-acetyltransferase [Candidatus Binatia bacterium]|nr:GNAT family N-acetyltransferase [Candidatus Binatia bacterium]